MQQDNPVKSDIQSWQRLREKSKHLLLRDLMHNPASAVRYLLRIPHKGTEEQIVLIKAAIGCLEDELERLKGGNGGG